VYLYGDEVGEREREWKFEEKREKDVWTGDRGHAHT